jgi:hypothetical protein
MILSQQQQQQQGSSKDDTTTITTDINSIKNITLVYSIYDLSKYHSTTTKQQRPHVITSSSSSSSSDTRSELSQHNEVDEEDKTRLYNISAAVCYKTLFGTTIDIGIILQWIGTSHTFPLFFFFHRIRCVLPNNTFTHTHSIHIYIIYIYILLQ